jgi:hypothetical protein
LLRRWAFDRRLVVGGLLVGYFLDDYLNIAPLFTLLLTLGGLVGAMRLLLNSSLADSGFAHGTRLQDTERLHWLLAAAACAAYQSSARALSLLLGGAVMGVNFWLLRSSVRGCSPPNGAVRGRPGPHADRSPSSSACSAVFLARTARPLAFGIGATCCWSPVSPRRCVGRARRGGLRIEVWRRNNTDSPGCRSFPG